MSSVLTEREETNHDEPLAQTIFSEFGGESKVWQTLFTCAMQHDLRLAFDIADRKYGKATQRVESKLHVGSSELADVLAIARKRVISNTPIETPEPRLHA